MATDKGERVLIEDDEKDLDQEKDEYVVVDQEPEKPSQDQEKDDDDDDDDDESSLKADDDEGESSSDREAIRERRRQEKKERKERREKAIGRDKLELNFLRHRNDELERRMMAIETQTNKQAVNDIDRKFKKPLVRQRQQKELLLKL